MGFIDIHPLDFGAILLEDENPTDVILHNPEGARYASEHIEYKGKFYRQTLDAPVTTDYGKRILKSLEKGTLTLEDK